MAKPVLGEEKMLDKVSKILNQAESLPEGPERDLFMSRAYTLSQAHSIDLAVARARTVQKEKPQEPEERSYTVGQRGGRSQSSKWAHFADLLIALGEAYDMKWVITKDRATVWLMGYPSDHDMISKMYTLLSTQMVADADAALKAGANKETRMVLVTEKVEIPEDEREWGGWDYKNQRWYVDQYQLADLDSDGEYWSDYAHRYVKPYYPPKHKTVPVLDSLGNRQFEEKLVSTVDGRVWRTNFYQAFVAKVRQRMREARLAAMKDAGIEVADESTPKGLALLEKKEEINARYENTMLVRVSKRSKGYGGAEVSRPSHSARRAGAEAAARATYGDEMVVE